VILAVTTEGATTAISRRYVSGLAICRTIGCDDAEIKIDQIELLAAMRIVARITTCAFLSNMLGMQVIRSNAEIRISA